MDNFTFASREYRVIAANLGVKAPLLTFQDEMQTAIGATWFTDPCKPDWIALNREWLDLLDHDEIRWTIIHELAHAEVGLLAEHGSAWEEMCAIFGIVPKQFMRLRRTETALARLGWSKFHIRLHMLSLDMAGILTPTCDQDVWLW